MVIQTVYCGYGLHIGGDLYLHLSLNATIYWDKRSKHKNKRFGVYF